MASTLQQLLQRQRGGRVQTGDLPDARVLQAAIRSGGQYNVQVQQAGKSKLTELAEGLSKINPALRDFTYGQTLQRGMSREAGEKAYLQDPEKAVSDLTTSLGKTKRELRKLADKGVIDERSNPDFMLGIRAAKAKAFAKNQLRTQLLTNPEALNASDPIAYAREKVAKFYEQDVFGGSQYAKDAVLPLLDKISNEYVSTVTSRQQDTAIAEGKINWLESISQEADAWSQGDLSLDDESFVEWLDDGAGSFKGSRTYAIQNLFTPILMDMTESGDMTAALLKLNEIKNWTVNKKTGAKFANAEIKQQLNTLEDRIFNRGTTFRRLAVEAYKRNVETVTDPFEAEILEMLNDDVAITTPVLNDWATRFRKDAEARGLTNKTTEEFIAKMREEAHKPYNQEDEVDSDPLELGRLRNIMNTGVEAKNDIDKAYFEDKLINRKDWLALKKENATTADFERNVMSLAPVRSFSQQLESEFTGRTVNELGVPMMSENLDYVKTLFNLDKKTNDVVKSSFSALGANMWRETLRKKREEIISDDANISADALNRALLKAVPDLQLKTREELDKEIKKRVGYGKIPLDLGLTKQDMDDHARTGNNTKVKGVLRKLGFDANTAASANYFLENYYATQFPQ